MCMIDITRDFSVISNDVSGVSLSLYYSQKSLTHNIGSASALPIIFEVAAHWIMGKGPGQAKQCGQSIIRCMQ